VTTIALFGIPVLAGVAAGLCSGGTFRGLLATRLRALRLLWLAAIVQVAQFSTRSLPRPYDTGLRLPLLAVTFALVIAWLVVNLRGRTRTMRAAAATIMAGGLLNATAIAANGRMPYLRSAAAAAGIGSGYQTAKNVAATTHTRLAAMGDVIPVPPLRAVVSIGDILIVGGTIILVAAAMRQTPRTTDLALGATEAP
jgi:uncharacterized protein DUF5317